MEGNEFNIAGEASGKATPVAKPTAEITKIMSNEFLKVVDLNERCNFFESDLKKWYKKVETLTATKVESGQIISEYKSRNKVNVVNSESLLQALNELYRYKCELKSSYITTEKALKAKQLKYKKVISCYESSWMNTLEKYNSDPVCVELDKIKQENILLEREIEQQDNLNASTKTQFLELKKMVKKKFVTNAVAFSRAMVRYKQFLNSSVQNEKIDFKKLENFKLFRETPRENKEDLFNSQENDDAGHTCSIDISVFDDIMVPSENLEDLDETGYSFLHTDVMPVTDLSKEEEAAEYLNNSKQTVENKTTANEDKESQYFRAQDLALPSSEQGSHSKENFNKQNGTEEKSKSTNNAIGLSPPENEEETSKDAPMECDDSLSEGSYERQMDNQRVENYDCHYRKTPSVSSEDLPRAGENPNESGEAAKSGDQGTNSRLKSDMEKNDLKSFTGFFTMGNVQDTPKPSIFKLF